MATSRRRRHRRRLARRRSTSRARRVGALAVQGNLDPALCVADADVAIEATRDVLRRAGTRAGPRLQPRATACCRSTDPGVLAEVVDVVHAEGRAGVAARVTRDRRPRAVPRDARVTRRDRALLHARSATAARRRAELLADLVRRYDAIGGLSPLAARTDAQVRGPRARELERRAPGRFVVEGATKYATPRDRGGASRRSSRRAPTTVVGLVLSPLDAPIVDRPVPRARARRDRRPRAVPRGVVVVASTRLRRARRRAGPRRRSTASRARAARRVHARTRSRSRVPGAHGRTPASSAAPRRRSRAAAGVDDHVVCWQSAGRTADAWLGPDVLEVLAALDAGRGAARSSSARSASSRTTSRCSTTSTSRPRAARASAASRCARTASLNDDADFSRSSPTSSRRSPRRDPRRRRRWGHRGARRRLRAHGRSRRRPRRRRAVTVLEAGGVGGKLACDTIGGRTVDVGSNWPGWRRPGLCVYSLSVLLEYRRPAAEDGGATPLLLQIMRTDWSDTLWCTARSAATLRLNAAANSCWYSSSCADHEVDAVAGGTARGP